MAGTLVYRLKVTHIYQRRFGQAELAEALRSSHWYIVTRRPTVRILNNSAVLDDRILTVDVTTSSNLGSSREVRTLGIDFGRYESLSNFRTYAHGAYFSVELDGQLAHGDAWSLASFLSTADTSLAAQEVLYIGEAYGKDGSNNAWNRLRAHEKLQQIYEDHADLDCEIFVAPLSLKKSMVVTDDHIDDDEDGPSLNEYQRHFVTPSGDIRKTSVDLIEHSLISHFVPHYNELLKEWRRDTPTKSMRKMRGAGFRLIQVHLSGWWGLARFHSTAVPDRYRSHLISHDIPPAPRRPALRGVSAESLSDWRHAAMMVQEGQGLLEEEAEKTGVTIRVFGGEAPTLRTPPGLMLPAVPQLTSNTEATRDRIRADIAEHRKETEKANAPVKHPGESTYDPKTGTIATGVQQDGTEARQMLHNPNTGKVASTVIFGDPGMGRSNNLTVLLVEAIRTTVFVPALADAADNGSHRKWFLGTHDDDEYFAEGVEESIRLLETMCRIVDHRIANHVYERPTAEVPAVLVGVDDADALLGDTHGVYLIRKILTEGGAAGVGIAVVLGDITAFEHDAALMRDLLSADYKQAYTPQGRWVLDYLNAKYRLKRSETWPEENTLFVVHRDNRGDSVLGLAAACVDARLPLPLAQRWAEHELRLASPIAPTEWRQVGEDSRSWETNVDVRHWFLRRHTDMWLLVLAVSETRTTTGPDLIRWATEAIDVRCVVDRGPWQVGPGTLAPGSEVFYSVARGEITPKNQSDLIKRLLANLY